MHAVKSANQRARPRAPCVALRQAARRPAQVSASRGELGRAPARAKHTGNTMFLVCREARPMKHIRKTIGFCVCRASWGCNWSRIRVSGECLGPLRALVWPFGRPHDRFGLSGQARQGRPGGLGGPGDRFEGRPESPKAPDPGRAVLQGFSHPPGL